jgi:hypothetical protein
MTRRSALRPWVALLVASACFDPLFEEGDPLTAGWVTCCVGSQLQTCQCPEASQCQSKATPCGPGGLCSSTPFCPLLQDAGTPLGGGGGGIGPQDAGVFVDAGNPSGGGVGTGGGVATGGGGGGGAPPPTRYEFCCEGGHVTTCACPTGGCAGAPFTSCANGSCIAGGAGRQCR